MFEFRVRAAEAERVMRQMRAWLLRLGDLFGRTRREREFVAEMESHLQMHIEDNLRAGMNEKKPGGRR